MTHAARTLTEELAYLRHMHTEAVTQGATIIANSIATDIADLVRALEVLEKLAQIAGGHPDDVKRAVREELSDGMYFACWERWDAA